MIVEILNSDLAKAGAEYIQTAAWAKRVDTIAGWVFGGGVLLSIFVILACCALAMTVDHFRGKKS